MSGFLSQLLIQLQQAVELQFFQQLIYCIGADSVDSADSTDSAISVIRVLPITDMVILC